MGENKWEVTMSVELEICVKHLPTSGGIVEQAKRELADLFGEDLDVGVTQESGDSSLRLSVDGQAEVDVSMDSDPESTDENWITVSYAPLRTDESKSLCIVVAIAVAKLSAADIVDDARMLGLSSTISANELAEVARKSASGSTFEERAKALASALQAGHRSE